MRSRRDGQVEGCDFCGVFWAPPGLPWSPRWSDPRPATVAQTAKQAVAGVDSPDFSPDVDPSKPGWNVLIHAGPASPLTALQASAPNSSVPEAAERFQQPNTQDYKSRDYKSQDYKSQDYKSNAPLISRGQ